MRSITIGAGQGFYGDTPRGALDVARNSDARYICCDALAELTMAILQKDRMRNPEGGYARDLPEFLRTLLPVCREKGIRLITNGGGMNPAGAAAAAAAVARDLGMADLRIASVAGDDLTARIDDLVAAGAGLDNADTGAAVATVRDRVVFAVAYLGMRPVRQALEQDADVVITGRVADASLFVAPLAHELGWADDDWDRLAAGVVAGHLMECSAQATGGNFSGDWRSIPDMAHIGYPVCEVSEDGSAVLSKPAGSGGRVSFETVREQLLYEVGDPRRYLNPDVVADFTSVRLEDLGGDRVRISGVRGAPRPETLKVILGYLDGWAATASLVYSWPEAAAKACHAAGILDELVADAGLTPLEKRVELLGLNALHGAAAPVSDIDDLNEVTLRYSARFATDTEAARLPRLATPLALNGPPHIGGGAVPAPPRALVGTWPALVDRGLVEPEIAVSVRRAGDA